MCPYDLDKAFGITTCDCMVMLANVFVIVCALLLLLSCRCCLRVCVVHVCVIVCCLVICVCVDFIHKSCPTSSASTAWDDKKHADWSILHTWYIHPHPHIYKLINIKRYINEFICLYIAVLHTYKEHWENDLAVPAKVSIPSMQWNTSTQHTPTASNDRAPYATHKMVLQHQTTESARAQTQCHNYFVRLMP